MKTLVNPSKGHSCAMCIARIGVVFYMLFMVGTAYAQTYNWIGSTPTSGGTYYLYTKNQHMFLNDNNGLDAYNTTNTQWKMGGKFKSSYTLTSANGKQFAIYRSWGTNHVVTNATEKSGNDINLTSDLDNLDTYYSIYRKEKFISGYRNVKSTSNGIEIAQDASFEWLFISQTEYNSTLPYYFAATAKTTTGGKATVSFDNSTWSTTDTINPTDPNAPSLTTTKLDTTVTFKAEAAAGYAFEGWQDGSGKIVSELAEYIDSISSSSHDSNAPASVTLTAKFSKTNKPTFSQNFESTTLTVGQSFSPAFTFGNTSSSTPSDNPSNDFYYTLTQNVTSTNLEGSLHRDQVITYDPATNTLTAENEGTATLTFTQKANGTWEAGTSTYTITVNKNSPNFRWNEAGVVLYTTTCYGDIFQSDNSDMLWSVKDPQPDAAIVQDFAQGSSKATGTLTTGSKAGSTNIIISQEENYKWYSQTETYTITIAERPLSSNVVLCDGPEYVSGTINKVYNYYRIPALGVDQTGKMYAMFDYRHKENSDIGNGHAIDICSKEGKYNSINDFTWDFIKKNHLIGTNDYGYGDPAIVVDADNNEVLVLCVCGGKKYKYGEQEQGAIWCKNGKWDENITSLTKQIKNLGAVGTGVNKWNTTGMFFASGRILQSRIVKTGTYYRLYAALLSSGYGNAVVYSDDFGRNWKVLGDAQTSCCPAGDEAKVEELSDGTIVLSSRAQRKRWFNVFTFTDLNAATGSWGTPAQPDRIMYGDGSPVNGDFYRLRVFHNGTPAEILLQFHTNENSERENLTCFWRDITGQTAATFNTADNWNVGLQIVSGQSCYSSMAIMPDGYIGLLWEDGTKNSTKEQYDIYFNTFTVSQLLKDNSYSPKVQLLYKFFIRNYQGQISGKDIYVYNVSQEDLSAVLHTPPTINPTGKDIRIETTPYTPTLSGDEYKATLTLRYGIYKEQYNLHIVPIKMGGTGSGSGATTEKDGTFIWRTDAFNSKWSDPNNWYVCYNGSTFTSNAVPMQSNNVIIPAGASIYPNIVTGNCYCNCIYLEAGARLGGQYLLNYNKAFVDVKVPANRYVRITPPLRDTYAGDFFTAEQGGEWTNFTPAMLSAVVEGTLDEGGKNRTTHATYESLYASTFQTLDPHGGITTHSVRSKWEAPYNSMEYKYEEGQGFDIWMDYDKDTDYATFHFPSGETQYDYFSEKEGKIVSQTAAIVRDEHQYRLAFDNTNTNRGYANFVFSRNAGATKPAFVIGNIGQAYLSIFNFLKTNVENMTTTPFLYKHTPMARDNEHGKQTVYFYLSSGGGKLFKAEPQAVKIDPNGVIKPPSDTERTEVDKKAPETMIAPNEAFMIMAGESKITSAEPHLIGNFSGTYRYYGVPFQKVDGSTIKKDGMAGGKPDELTRDFVFSIAADPNDVYRVRIGNFVGRGYVWGTINPQKKTLTIQAGTAVTYVDNTSWENGDRILRIYGCDDDKLAFTDWFTYKSGSYNWGINKYNAQTKKVTNAHSDIVFDYTVDVVNGIAKFTLRRPFVIYSREYNFDSSAPTYRKDKGDENSTPMGLQQNQEEECESFFVYDQLLASKTFEEHEDPFIYPEIEGKYKANVSSITGTPQGVATGEYQSITIERILGNYDHVLIDGLYPNCTNTPVVGKITLGSDDKYHLSIPESQLVNEQDANNTSANYFFYTKGRGKAIEMVWDNAKKTWTQAGKQLQISHLNANPSSSSDGFLIGDGTNGVFHQTEHIEPDDIILLSSQNDRLQISFTPHMFAANVSELQIAGASLHAPARVEDNPVVSITANDGTYQTSTLIVVDEYADNDFRKKEDAPLFDIHKSAFCLGTIAGTQLVGINSIAELDNLPLYISASATIVCNNIEALGDEVELYDAINDISTPIHNNQPLQLYIADGEQAGKYYLRLASAPEDIPSDDNSFTEVNTVVYSPARATIVVNSSQPAEEMQVYDMAGQLVASVQNVQRHQFTGLQQGIYVVKITHANNTKQVKVTVF